MNFIEASLCILLIAIISVPLANRLKIPLEIFLFLGSCLISLTPGLPVIKVDPMIVFELFLPPILFSAAYFTSWKDFKFNIRPITQLAFGLVIFTTVMIAVTAKYILPGFTWAEAFLLGAVISPTDAAASTTIIKKLGAPRRIVVLLEGESLINDATALILYRFSLGAILYGTFSLSSAIMKFIMLTVGGALVGFAIAYAAIYILRKLKDTQAETAFTFIVAFSSYLIAEHLGVSGVIATVTAGIFFGIRLPQSLAAHTRMNATAAWRVALFMINAFVYALIGFQMPVIINNLGSYSSVDLLYYGSVISLMVMLARLLWIFPSAYLPRKLIPAIGRKDPMPSWQALFTIGWVGMRGIVSLAAVLAIPASKYGGLPQGHINLLIFITYFVIATTLVVPAITLPFLMRWFKLSDTTDKMSEEAKGRMQMIDAAIGAITMLAQKENISQKALDEYIRQYERKRKIVEFRLSETPFSAICDDYFSLKNIAHKAIEAERAALIKLRKHGEIHDELFWSLSEELDIEAMRLKSGFV